MRLSQTVQALKGELQGNWPLGELLVLRCGTKLLRDAATLQSSGVRSESIVSIHLKGALKGGSKPAEAPPASYAAAAATPAQASRRPVEALECMFFSNIRPGRGNAMDRANEDPFFVVQTCLGTQLNLQEDDQPNMHGQVCKISCFWLDSSWTVIRSTPPPGFVALVEPLGDRWLGNKLFSKNFASDIADIAAKIDSAHKPGLLIIGLPADLKVDHT